MRALTSVDLLPLRLEPPVAEVVGVVGEAQEAVAREPSPRRAISSIEALPSADHVEWQCISPTRSPSSTATGSVPLARRGDLVRSLAELGRHVRVAEVRIEILLGRDA